MLVGQVHPQAQLQPEEVPPPEPLPPEPSPVTASAGGGRDGIGGRSSRLSGGGRTTMSESPTNCPVARVENENVLGKLVIDRSGWWSSRPSCPPTWYTPPGPVSAPPVISSRTSNSPA